MHILKQLTYQQNLIIKSDQKWSKWIKCQLMVSKKVLKTLYYDENNVAQESKVKELDQQDTLRWKGVMRDKKIHS